MSKRTRSQNALFVFVSFLLAVVLWLHVQDQTTLLKPTKWAVDVTSVNLPSYLVQVSVARTVVVTLKTTEDIRPEDLKKISATVDLSAAKVGVNSPFVQIQLPASIKAEFTVSPRRVEVDIDRFVTQRMPITLRTSGLQRANLVYAGSTFQPTNVDVKGAESQVKTVQQVRAILDLSQARPGGEWMEVRPEPLTKNDKPVRSVTCDPDVIAVRAAFTPAPTQRSLIITPNWTGQPAFGYEVSRVEVVPNQVEARGKSELIASLVSVQTEPVSVEGLKGDTFVETRLKLPPGVRIASSTVIRVHVFVRRSPSVGGTARDGP